MEPRSLSTDTHRHTKTHPGTHSHTQTHTDTHRHIQTDTHRHTLRHTGPHRHTHAAQAHTQAHIDTHTHTHIHICTRFLCVYLLQIAVVFSLPVDAGLTVHTTSILELLRLMHPKKMNQRSRKWTLFLYFLWR